MKIKKTITTVEETTVVLPFYYKDGGEKNHFHFIFETEEGDREVEIGRYDTKTTSFIYTERNVFRTPDDVTEITREEFLKVYDEFLDSVIKTAEEVVYKNELCLPHQSKADKQFITETL